MATEAYCVKCREKREMKDAREVTMKNGRDAIDYSSTRLLRCTTSEPYW